MAPPLMAALSVPLPSSSSFASPSVPFPWPNGHTSPNPPSPPPLMEDLQCPQPSPPPSIDPGEDFATSSPTSHASAPPPPLLLPASSSSSPSKVAADCVAPTLLHLSFNQDHSCFAAGTDRGFRIYTCEPFLEAFRRDLDGGGIGFVGMLFSCNIIALVGGGCRPYQPPKKVMIWDDYQRQCLGELSFRSEVLAVRLRRDRIIVVLNRKVSVHNFNDLKLLHQIETMPNPRGLCVVTLQQGSFVLVCPGSVKGQVRVEHYEARRTKFIMAHGSSLACFALSQDGRLLATASTKGTLIRIFSTADGTLLQEVRRGADRANIYSMALSADMKWLAVSSDKGTVHVFSLKVNLGSTVYDKPHLASDPNASSPSSQFSFIKGVLPKYFNSEWSVAKFRLRENLQYVVGFGLQKNTVEIIGMDGRFFLCRFDPEAGGEMTQLECHKFLKADA